MQSRGGRPLNHRQFLLNESTQNNVRQHEQLQSQALNKDTSAILAASSIRAREIRALVPPFRGKESARILCLLYSTHTSILFVFTRQHIPVVLSVSFSVVMLTTEDLRYSQERKAVVTSGYRRGRVGGIVIFLGYNRIQFEMLRVLLSVEEKKPEIN